MMLTFGTATGASDPISERTGPKNMGIFHIEVKALSVPSTRRVLILVDIEKLPEQTLMEFLTQSDIDVRKIRGFSKSIDLIDDTWEPLTGNALSSLGVPADQQLPDLSLSSLRQLFTPTYRLVVIGTCGPGVADCNSEAIFNELFRRLHTPEGQAELRQGPKLLAMFHALGERLKTIN
jgi:hypothetical protein